MQVTTVGVDLAKRVFQVQGVDAQGQVVVRKRLSRGQLKAYFSALPPALVGMEACASGHYWARVLGGLWASGTAHPSAMGQALPQGQ